MDLKAVSLSMALGLVLGQVTLIGSEELALGARKVDLIFTTNSISVNLPRGRMSSIVFF
uniref:Uncharacterized protein n=1 Tax=Picea glauca TaxID=3330 RepID=A0A101LZP7_PICGL|nr:hypothetical protein ABT39_MTgene5312 [Picea glauca]QHR88891.1 hypothetical protein Q903MT_gene2910 [Picea sitchensis]